MDDQEMEQGEQAEDQALQQILQLCQSGDPAALPQIAKIVQGLLQHNQQEEGAEGAEGKSPEDQAQHDALLAAVKKQMGGE